MNIIFRLAWRNLWRHRRRTWLTVGAMVFSNTLLVFMISMQFGMYDLMIDNTLKVFTGHMQVQAPGYKDDQKMRQTVPDILPLAGRLRDEFPTEQIAARAWAFALASSAVLPAPSSKATPTSQSMAAVWPRHPSTSV